MGLGLHSQPASHAVAVSALEVFRGASNAEIARHRGASVKTIANQLDTIYRKLAVTSRAELVLLLRAGAAPSEREES